MISADRGTSRSSGFIYHRKYLDMYTHQLPHEARDYVDEVANCDDLLFNYMMANATGTGPARASAFASFPRSFQF